MCQEATFAVRYMILCEVEASLILETDYPCTTAALSVSLQRLATNRSHQTSISAGLASEKPDKGLDQNRYLARDMGARKLHDVNTGSGIPLLCLT
jgi:hypothetical protein